MRTKFLLAVAVASLVACGEDSATDQLDAGGNPGDLEPPTSGFQIQTPPIEIGPGEEATYCYYATIPISAEAGIKKWTSKMTAGSHHMIVFFTQTETQPAGTLANCGGEGGGAPGGGLSSVPVWAYAAQMADQTAEMPAGVGLTVAANQPAMIQMHYLNTADTPLMATVTLNGETYGPGESYMKAGAFVTYNTLINLPPNSAGSTQGSCTVPPDARFFVMSTHAHKHALETKVSDGATVVFQSTNWEHPGAKDWPAEPFYTFASGKLTYQCDYYNATSTFVKTGPTTDDEMCMAVGYFFPATASKMCVNSSVLN
jgi:hypothetical protein